MALGQIPGAVGRKTRFLRRKVASLVASGAAQREGFERGQLTVRAHHVIVGDVDRGEVAGMGSRIDGE
jgi:hypothetical protein